MNIGLIDSFMTEKYTIKCRTLLNESVSYGSTKTLNFNQKREKDCAKKSGLDKIQIIINVTKC